MICIVPYSYLATLQFSVVNIFVHLILYIIFSSIAERKVHLSLIFPYVSFRNVKPKSIYFNHSASCCDSSNSFIKVLYFRHSMDSVRNSEIGGCN